MTDEHDQIMLSLADSKQPRNLLCRMHSKEPLRVYINAKLVESKQIATEIRFQPWKIGMLIPPSHKYYIPFMRSVVENEPVFSYVDRATGDLTCEWVKGVSEETILKDLEGMAMKYPLVPCSACAIPCAIHWKCSACWFGENRRVVYCSRKCHIKHWPEHRLVCYKKKSC
jgi:hypothetical protein